MAASITGTFTIIDRASGTMRSMEHQALRTMAAIEAVGAAQDKTGSRSQSTGRKLAETERVMGNVERASRRTESQMRRTGSETDRLGQSSERLGQKMIRLNSVFGFFGKVLGGLKIAGLASGISLLVEGVGALAGGLFALLPGLAQASGAIAALPQITMAAIQGFSVFKLAMGGVMSAIQAGMKLQAGAGRNAQDYADQMRTAGHSVAEAEWGIQQATVATANAQRDLTQARRDAVRQLTDLKLAALGADLSQQQAALSLREARRTLAQAAINPQTTDLDMQGYNLAVRQAELQVRQSRVDRNRAHVDEHRARQRGVSGNLNVLSSEQALTNAIHSQKNAVFELQSAEIALQRLRQRGTGLTDAYRQALKSLSPSARGFVEHVVGMYDQFKALRESAGGGLFIGLNKALDHIQGAFPTLSRIVGRTGDTLGHVFDQLTGRLTSRNRLNDIEQLALGNDRILRRMGRGIGNVMSALIDFMRAAQPFTDWLTQQITDWTNWLALWAKTKRANGDFAAALERTRARLVQFHDIMHNLWVVLKNTLAAATPLGDKLWSGFDKATKGWAMFTRQNQASMTDWFNHLYPALHEFGQLLHDLAVAWAQISIDPSLTKSLTALDKHVPAIQSFFKAAAGFGPALINTVGAILRLFNDLPISPIKTVLDLFAGIMHALDWLIRKVPIVKYALTGLLLAATLRKSIGLVELLISRWGVLFGLWERGGGPSFFGGPRGPGGAPGGGGGPVVVPGGGTGSGAARGGGRGGFFGRIFGRGGGGAAMTEAERKAAMVANAWGGASPVAAEAGKAGGILSRLGGVGGRALGVAGRFAGPLAIFAGLSAAMSGYQRWGNVNGAAYSVANMADFGTGGFSNWFDPGADSQQRLANAQSAEQSIFKRFSNRHATAYAPGRGVDRYGIQNTHQIHGRRAQMYMLNNFIRNPSGAELDTDLGSGKERDKLLAQMVDHAKTLRANLRAAWRDQARTHRDMLDQKSVAKAQSRGAELGSVFQTYLKATGNAQTASQKTTDMVTHALKTMRGAGVLELGQMTLDWAKHQVKIGQMSRQTYDDLKTDIEKRMEKLHRSITIINGQIYTSTDSAWQSIAGSLTSWTEKALEGTTKGFTAMQQHAVKGLQQMGFSHAQARDIVEGVARGGQAARSANAIASGGLTTAATSGSYAPSGLNGGAGARNAAGGRIPGTGLSDNIMVAPGQLAAPGELIVNRHTERRLNGLLSMFGTSLGGEVEGERKPHYMSFAGGGRIASLKPYNHRYPMHLTGTPGASLPVNVIRAIAENAGFAPGVALQMSQIAHGESGYQPGVQQRDPGDGNVGYGLWQITPHAWGGGPALAHMNALGGIPAMFNPIVNAYMAKYLYDAGGLSPWYGTRYLNRNLNTAGIHSVFSGGHIRPGGGGAGGRWHVPIPRTGLGGIPGGFQQGAFNIYAAGIDKVVNQALNSNIATTGGGAVGGVQGPKGLATFKGVTMARWIANELNWATQHGWSGQPTSGYRPGFDPHTASGTSMHQGTQYPGGAVDFGGFVDPAAYRTKLALVQLADRLHYSGPRLRMPIGFRDDGHLSGTGHALGGRVGWGGWNARGGRFNVTRPTLFGAGEAGPETVSIKPKGHVSATRGGHTFHIDIARIDYRGEGDIKKAIERELELLAEDLNLVGVEED